MSNSPKRIFLDHAAGENNPNTMYLEGREASITIREAKQTLASYINASPAQILLAPSASLVNYFLLNLFDQVTATSTEHQSIINHPKIRSLLDVDSSGHIVDVPGSFPKNSLVSISLANHEIATIQDLVTTTKSIHKKGALLHSDLSASFTKLPIDVQALDLDFATISGSKLGVSGSAALYTKIPDKKLYKFPLGTPNIQASSALNAFLQKNPDLPNLYTSKVLPLRNHLASRLLAEIPNTILNGDQDHSLPHILNASFAGAEGESVLLLLDQYGIAVSTGSACALGAPSHVIDAISGDPVLAHNSIRFSLGLDTTKADIDFTVDKLKEILINLRGYTTCQ